MDLKEAVLFQNARRHPWEMARLEIIDAGLKRICRERGKQNLKVLDIGSGDMFVVAELARRNPGLSFAAVDNHFTAEIMEKFTPMLPQDRVKMYPSLEEWRKESGGAADLITLFDVVEHIDQDEAFLKSLHSAGAVHAETRLFITVPSYQALFCSHDVFLEHYRRHTRKTIAGVTTAAGFVPERSGYFFFMLIPPRIFTVIKEKIFGRPKDHGTGLSEWKGGGFLTGLLRGMLMTDYRIGSFFRWFGLHLPGLSTFIVCKASA